jgi:integrase
LCPSHLRRQAAEKKSRPRRAPRDHYDRHSYAQAVARAARRAGVPHWHPHPLKHTCGTAVREAYGAEGAQGYIGHEKLSTAEMYAQKNWNLIEQIALDLG